MDEWDDAGFDMVEAPPIVNSVTVNSSGSRVAVAHSRGVDVYQLYARPTDASASEETMKAHHQQPSSAGPAVPGLEPRVILRLTGKHLDPAAALRAGSSDFLDEFAETEERAELVGPHHRRTGSAGSAGTGRSPRGGGSGSAPAAPPQLNAGVGLVALLYETNVLAVVGGGDAPCHPPNRVVLFNGEYEQQRINLLGPVARVVLQNHRVIALSQTFLTIHAFTGEKLLEEPANGWSAAPPLGHPSVARMSSAAIASMLHKAGGVPSGAAGRPPPKVASSSAVPTPRESPPNAIASLRPGSRPPPSPEGGTRLQADTAAAAAASHLYLRRMPMDVTNVESNPVVAFADAVDGTVAFCDWLAATRLPTRIAAHRGEIDMLALCANGEALVTASDTNTVLRVWNVASGARLREVRLGSAPRTTYLRSLALYSRLGERSSSAPSEFVPEVAASLDSKGELKFFYVGTGATGGAGAGDDAGSDFPLDSNARNRGSFFSKFQFVSSYFASEWHASSVMLPFLPNAAGAMEPSRRGVSGSGTMANDPLAGGAPSPSASVHYSTSTVVPPPSTTNASFKGTTSVMPVDSAAWIELPASIAKYVSTSGCAPSGAGAAGSGGGRGHVSMLCAAGNGVVARVVFNVLTGKAEQVARVAFSASL